MNLDLIPNGAIKRVHVSQNDIGRTLTFELFNNSTSYTVPSGATVKIQGTKPSGFGFSETCTVSGNVVTVDTTEEMTDEYGYIETELQIKYNGNTIGTSNFVLAVEKNPHPDTTTDGSTETIIPELTLLVNEVKGYAEEIEGTYHAYSSPWVASTVAQMTDTDKIYVYVGSESGYTSGNWYYYNGSAWVSGGVYNSVAVQTDTTLTQSGVPADAKAVGGLKEEINGYLPTGDLIEKRYIDNNGNQTYYNGWSCTGFINVADYNTITIIATVASAYNSFYDSAKGHIGNFSLVSGTNEIELPSGTSYIRMSNTDSGMATTEILSHIGTLQNDVNDNATDIVHTNDYILSNVEAQKNGYYKAIDLKWESGSIYYPSGTNHTPDENVIRTPLPRFKLSGNVRLIIKDTKYRIRIFGFPNESDSGTYDSGWYRYDGTYTVTINTELYYRIQIATNTAESMDMDEALRSILIAYESDSMSDIKPYWNEYIETKVQTINNYLTDGTNKTAFLFLTDTHWNESASQLNSYGINAPLMRYLRNRCNIDYVIHGGDLNSEYRSNKNIARELMTKPMALMRDAFDHVLVTRGNHDDNNEGAYKDWAYTISQSDSYSYMFRNTKNVTFGETGTYFYHDIPFENVRIISLDCVDFPYTNDVDATLLDEKNLAYGYTQLQWFCDVLKNTPSSYHIVIYTHAMIAPSVVTVEHPNDSPQTRAMNFGVVARILKAYKNRENFNLDITGWFTSLHQDYYDGVLSDDFGNCLASIVGVFSGHEHVDCIEEIEVDGTGIGIYNTCTQNSSAMFGDSVISHSYQHPMEIGTTSELVWDMVVIDRKNKHVDMIRIGANGANTDVETFDVRSFNYV